MTVRTADEMAKTALRVLRSAQGSDPAMIAIGYALLALYEQNVEARDDPIGRLRLSDADDSPHPDQWVTKSGRILTDDDIQALADEAEAGYDVSHLKGKPARPVGLDIRRGEV